MANEIRIDLVAKGATQAAKEIDKVAKAADNAGDDLKGMAAGAEVAGSAADGAGDEFREMATDAKILDKAIEDLNASLIETRAALAQSPDDKLLWKSVRGQERKVNQLTKLRKMVFGDEDPKTVGVQVGKQLGSGISEALGALPAQLKGAGLAIGVGLALAAAPVIGGAIGAAVIGGVGIGGIAGGIAAAAQDPRVKAAGESLGDSLAAGFAGIGAPFVEPLVVQMQRLEGIVPTFFSRLGTDIAPLADHLDNLVDGVEGFVDKFDLGPAVKAAGPLIDVIGKELPEVAEAVTDAFNSMAEESDGLATSLTQVFDVLEGGIRVTGEVVGALAATNQALSDLNEWGDEFTDSKWSLANPGIEMDGYTERVIRARGALDDFGDGVDGAGKVVKSTSEEVVDLSDAFDKLFGKQMSLDEANAAYKQGLADLKDELTDGKRTLNENTQAGRDNASAVRDQIQKIEDLREAQFNQTGNLQEANATYDKHIAQLRTTLANLGYNKAEIEKLIGAYQRLPKDGVDITVRSPGLWAALQRARELAGLLGSFAAGRNAAEGNDYVSGRASGGPVVAGRPYVVGEDGPELVTFSQDGYVHDAAKTKAMMSGSSGGAWSGAGSAAPRGSVDVNFNFNGAEDEFTRLIRKLVEVLGGGDVQVAFGRN